MISITEEQAELICRILDCLCKREKIYIEHMVLLKLQEDINKLIFDNALRDLPLGPFSGAPHTELEKKKEDK